VFTALCAREFYDQQYATSHSTAVIIIIIDSRSICTIFTLYNRLDPVDATTPWEEPKVMEALEWAADEMFVTEMVRGMAITLESR
jgi:hypothetical protein